MNKSLKVIVLALLLSNSFVAKAGVWDLFVTYFFLKGLFCHRVVFWNSCSCKECKPEGCGCLDRKVLKKLLKEKTIQQQKKLQNTEDADMCAF